jgi:ATP-dependent protease ClpP protease subunit
MGRLGDHFLTVQLSEMNLFIEGKFCDENIEKLFKAMNEGSHVRIYIESSGGRLAAAEIMADAVNRRGNCSLVAASDLFSAAFVFFFLCRRAERDILDNAAGMFHLPSNSIQTLANGKMKDEMEAAKNGTHQPNVMAFAERFMDELGFTETEKKKVRSGRELHLDATRMREMLNFQKNA